MNKGEQVIGSFWEVLRKMMWLNEMRMKEQLKDYKPSEIHFIEYIGEHSDPKVTELAESYHMTTGGATKLTKKLVQKGLIESYQKPQNKKEVYFRLTNQGQEIFRIHQKLHEEFQKRDDIIFEQVAEEDYDQMLKFVEMYGTHLDKEIQKLKTAKTFDKL